MKKTVNSMQKVSRRFASVFVSAALAASMIPAVAFADVDSSQTDDLESLGSATMGSTVLEQTDTSNSFRFVDGRPIPSTQWASADGKGIRMNAFSAVPNSAGHSVFDSFDKFDKGYYTGTDAKKVIDVSQWNRDIDWKSVKASGVNYAIIRCGYGVDDRSQDDKYWKQNVSGCIANGIPFGVYLYSYATDTGRASSEADHVLRCLREAGLSPYSVGLPIFYDMEDSSTANADLAAIAQTFCNKIQAAGYEVGVYSFKNWWTSKLTAPCFNGWYKWVAEWNASIGLTYDGFSNFRASKGFWQFSNYGTIPGISTKVDLNYTYFASVDAGSQPLPNGDYWIKSSLNPGQVLDITAGSRDDGANAQIYSANSSYAQCFHLSYADGFYTIINKNSGKVLDVSGASVLNGANIQQYASNGSHAQQWRIDRNSDGTYTLICRASGKALDIAGGSTANGANVQQYVSNGSGAQHFYLDSVQAAPGSRVVDEDIYTIASSLSANGVLDIPGASTANGANVQIYSANGTDAQRYRLIYDDNGYYTLINVSSGKALDVASGALGDSANVQQYVSNGTDAQKWRIDRNSDGTYTFVAKHSGKALDIAGASTANGANVQVYSSNGTPAQKFNLLKG